MASTARTLKLWRTFKEGAVNFGRNGWLSVAAITVISQALFIIALATLVTLGIRSMVANLENRISLSVSFNPDVEEGRILAIKDQLMKYREIAAIQYLSREAALSTFLAKSLDDPIVKQALDQIGGNPLLASLSVRAKRQADYAVITQALEQSEFQNDIAHINYAKNAAIFERLNRMGFVAQRLGLILGGVFGLIALIITFSTIRITIYSHRQEFEIMRLVGASNLYVRMPFVFEGMLYGLCAALIALAALGVAAWFLGPMTAGALIEGNVFRLFLRVLPWLAPAVAGIGIFLGAVSGYIAIRRYLRT